MFLCESTVNIRAVRDSPSARAVSVNSIFPRLAAEWYTPQRPRTTFGDPLLSACETRSALVLPEPGALVTPIVIDLCLYGAILVLTFVAMKGAEACSKSKIVICRLVLGMRLMCQSSRGCGLAHFPSH